MFFTLPEVKYIFVTADISTLAQTFNRPDKWYGGFPNQLGQVRWQMISISFSRMETKQINTNDLQQVEIINFLLPSSIILK